jgi:hypothetical protein
MILLLPHPLTPSPVSQLSLVLSLPVCRRSSLPTGEMGERVGEEQNHTTPRKPGPLKLIQFYLGQVIIPWGQVAMQVRYVALQITGVRYIQDWRLFVVLV